MQAADAAYETLRDQAAPDIDRTASDIAKTEFEALVEAWGERAGNQGGADRKSVV